MHAGWTTPEPHGMPPIAERSCDDYSLIAAAGTGGQTGQNEFVQYLSTCFLTTRKLLNMEREKGLEPSTSTLARLRSTN